MTLDVAILGGGPAGVAAALSLRQQLPNAKLAIFDAGRRLEWKPGETLSPMARPLLESLGCWGELQRSIADGTTLESYGTESAWGSEPVQANPFLFTRHGNGWRLNRTKFDAMMLDLAQDAGVAVHRGATLVGSAEQEEGWKLELANGKAEAHFAIDATGRTARFAVERRGVRLEPADRLAGVFVLFDCQCSEAADCDTLIEARENGWWYSTSVTGGTLVVAWMSDTDLIRATKLKDAARWHSLLAESKETRKRTEKATARSSPMIFAAQSQRLSKPAGTGWAAAGDAAMAFDPLSAHGITKALRSGKLVSFVARDWLSNKSDTHERYCRIADAEWAQYEEARRAYYAEEQRWPSSIFWARRQAAFAK
jgi:flavin-dependent dehydrogenase